MNGGGEMTKLTPIRGETGAIRAGAVITALAIAVIGAPVAEARTQSVVQASSPNPVVAVTGGAIRGGTEAGGYVFRGIPYAAAPTGSLRWRPPAPPTPSTAMRDDTNFAAGGPAMDPAQHCSFWRRPRKRDDRGPIRRCTFGPGSPHLARLEGIVPAGHR